MTIRKKKSIQHLISWTEYISNVKWYAKSFCRWHIQFTIQHFREHDWPDTQFRRTDLLRPKMGKWFQCKQTTKVTTESNSMLICARLKIKNSPCELDDRFDFQLNYPLAISSVSFEQHQSFHSSLDCIQFPRRFSDLHLRTFPPDELLVVEFVLLLSFNECFYWQQTTSNGSGFEREFL